MPEESQIWTEREEKNLTFEATGQATEEDLHDFDTMFDKKTPAVAKNDDNQTEDNAAKSIDAFNLKVDQFLMSKREQYQQFVDMSLEIKTIL